jgi:hypothetical protein
VSCRLRQKLLKVLKEVWSVSEQLCHLSINITYRFRLSLVSLQDFEELFVDVRLLSESILKVRGRLASKLHSKKWSRR